MSLSQLYNLLTLNQKLMLEAIEQNAPIKRLLELQAHRIEVMKCILEHYEAKKVA